MKSLVLLSLVTGSLFAAAPLANNTCKTCHPKIYKEYQNSYHANASVYKDKVFVAIWHKHPASKKNNFQCKQCHTPSDKGLMEGKYKLHENAVQLHEPISCQTCHQIKDVEKHAKANKNIYTTKPKTFYAADPEKKGTKVEFKEERSFLGLFTKTTGSPYHDIDYSNELYYNGGSCLGCHDHKQNAKGFTVCDLEVKQGDTKENCISCHMPKVKGAVANQKATPVHSFHGASALVSDPSKLSKTVALMLKKGEKGFDVVLENKANHTLAPHPLRLAQLRVTIQRDGETITLPVRNFARVIGADGKPAFPWLADAVLKDTTIKAFEKRSFTFDKQLQKGDVVTVEFGYYKVNPKIAPKLELDPKEVSKFIVLKKKRFTI